MPLRDAFSPETWKKFYTMHDVESCLARVQVVGFNEKRVRLLYSKTCVKWSLKIDKTKVLMTKW